MRYAATLVALLGLFALGCQSNKLADMPPPEDTISGIGTVQYIDLEGGFYGIVAEDGTQYQPEQVPEGFRQDGLRVRFRVQVRENVMTTRMWGTPVTIVDLARVTVDP